MQAAAAAIDEQLRSAGTPERAAQEKRYLKSELEFFGVTVPAIRKIVGGFTSEHPDLPRREALALARELWSEPVHERRAAAVELLDRYSDRLTPDDLRLVERLIRESRTWALVDKLAIVAAGGLVERYPELASDLDRWSCDPDFWVRRSALLALLIPLRRGDGDFERFGRYAESMLDEREFFIRKAIGWVLREAGRANPGIVDEWLSTRTHRASGVTVREAVKYLPDARKKALLAAYREHRPAR